MQLHFAPSQNYDCIQCGRGCQAGWDIPVEAHIVSQLEQHPLTLRVIQEQGCSPMRAKGEKVVLSTSPGCGYLEPDRLCGVHRHIGVSAKPNTCRLFPMIISRAPDGYHVGVSFSCSSVRQNSGRPLAEHSADVTEMIAAGTLVNIIPADGLPIHGPWFSDYEDCRQLESAIQARAAASSYRQALAEVLGSLAASLADLPKPRNNISRPLPVDTLPNICNRPPGSPPAVLARLPGWLWSLMAPQLGPELAGVEPSLREAYQQVAARLQQATPTELNERLQRPLGPELETEVERYLAHMVARKQLVIHPTLLSSLCMLHFLPYFLSLYSHGLAELRGRNVSVTDYYDALDLAEKFLVYHCRGLRPLYQRAARALVEELRPQPAATPET